MTYERIDPALSQYAIYDTTDYIYDASQKNFNCIQSKIGSRLSIKYIQFIYNRKGRIGAAFSPKTFCLNYGVNIDSLEPSFDSTYTQLVYVESKERVHHRKSTSWMGTREIIDSTTYIYSLDNYFNYAFNHVKALNGPQSADTFIYNGMTTYQYNARGNLVELSTTSTSNGTIEFRYEYDDK